MAEKKKILYIVEAMGGGVFTYIVDLANELVDTYDMYIAYAVRKQTPSNYKDYFDKRMNMFEDFIGYQGSAVLDEPVREEDSYSSFRRCWRQMVWQQEKTISLKDGMMPRKMQLSFRLKKMNKVPSRLKSVQLDITSTWSYNTSKWT